MRGVFIGISKATMVDDRGIFYTAIKDGNVWMFEGIAYSNPFMAFMNVERRLTLTN